MRIYRFSLLWIKVVSILSVGLAYAGDMNPDHSPTQFVSSFGIGPGWYQAGRTQNLLLQPGFSNTYVANQNHRNLTNGELFLGLSRQLHPLFWGQLGIAGALASPARLSGLILEAGEPLLDNFNYDYHIDHGQVSLKGKLLTLFKQNWYPYVSAALGAGFNTSTHYSSTPLIFEILPTAPFTNHRITSFAYTLGIGLQKAISVHWQWGVGYEFSDWGKSQLGPIAGMEINSAPALNHLYVNQLMFNITFLS